MANHYVTNPIEVVSVGQRVKVKVLDLDLEREKVSLTMKDGTASDLPPRHVASDVSERKPSSSGPRERVQENDENTESSLRGNISFS